MVSFFARIHSILLFNRLVIVTLFFIFLVILAGIFVRVTGSGMGCPDWPKCYGLIIPPTNANQLDWLPYTDYAKGQMIIKEIDSSFLLLKSHSNFTSRDSWNNLNWIEISDSKHDYSTFSPFKTWTEYINRCLGAISGVCIIILVITSFLYKKIPSYLFGFSLLLICLSLLQYWLGRNVVYSVLESQKITIHFFVALIFIPILLFLLYKSNYLLKKDRDVNNSISVGLKIEKPKNRLIQMLQKYFLSFLIFGLIVSILQMFFGTQVRGQVDQNILIALDSLDLLIHRFIVPVIVLINIALVITLKYLNNKVSQRNVFKEKMILIFVLILLIFTGSYMYLFELAESVKPKWTTLIHAYSSVILFSIYVSLSLKHIVYKTT